MDVWFCRVAGEIFGPLNSASIRDMAAQGLIHAETETRNGAGGEWQPLGDIQGLLNPVEGVAQLEVPEAAPVNTKPKARYGSLGLVATSISLTARLIVWLYVSGSLLLAIAATVGLPKNGWAGGVAVLAAAVLLSPIVLWLRVTIMAKAQLIRVAIDTAEATREAADHLKVIREQMAATATP